MVTSVFSGENAMNRNVYRHNFGKQLKNFQRDNNCLMSSPSIYLFFSDFRTTAIIRCFRKISVLVVTRALRSMYIPTAHEFAFETRLRCRHFAFGCTKHTHTETFNNIRTTTNKQQTKPKNHTNQCRYRSIPAAQIGSSAVDRHSRLNDRQICV